MLSNPLEIVNAQFSFRQENMVKVHKEVITRNMSSKVTDSGLSEFSKTSPGVGLSLFSKGITPAFSGISQVEHLRVLVFEGGEFNVP